MSKGSKGRSARPIGRGASSSPLDRAIEPPPVLEPEPELEVVLERARPSAISEEPPRDGPTRPLPTPAPFEGGLEGLTPAAVDAEPEPFPGQVVLIAAGGDGRAAPGIVVAVHPGRVIDAVFFHPPLWSNGGASSASFAGQLQRGSQPREWRPLERA